MAIKERLRLAILKRAPTFSPRPPEAPEDSQPTKILVIRPDHLGDMILSFPAFRLLRTAFPEARITALVGPWSRAPVSANPDIDVVETCPFPGFTRRPKGPPWAPYVLLRQEAQRLREEGFDVALNLRPDFWWGAMLAYMAGIPRRIGYDVPECVPFLSQALPQQADRHHVEQSVNLVRVMAGEEGATFRPELWYPVGPDDTSFARDISRSWPGEGPLVIIHPGSGAPVKLWTPPGFAQVADALTERYGARVVLIGGPGEEGLVLAVAHAASRRPHILMGMTLGQIAALLEISRLAIGLDSGVMHLAVAVGTPSIHLYGPVARTTFGPWGLAEKHVVVTSNLPCIPCNRLDYRKRELARHPCVRDIPAAKVLGAAERLLGPGPSGGAELKREALV
ncbi:MAG: glycosyltransferase family 9 protein [Dehalococcoidia bacterium]|nr:glycosyltransferase family 9 protein [Dehalococcoidia bacterium]